MLDKKRKLLLADRYLQYSINCLNSASYMLSNETMITHYEWVRIWKVEMAKFALSFWH
jgi:hypothetical protein